MNQADVDVAKVLSSDFFTIFAIKKSCFIDLEDLEEQYLLWQQKIYNLDIDDTKKENLFLKINEGYRILSDNFLHISYLLELYDINLSAKINPILLEKYLDLQEQIILADTVNKINTLKIALEQEKKDILAEIERYLNSEKLDKIATLFPQFSFSNRLLENVKIRHQKISQK